MYVTLPINVFVGLLSYDTLFEKIGKYASLKDHTFISAATGSATGG